VADARESDASERHGFNEQMNVHLVDRATAEGQTREEVVDRLLVTAEKENRKGVLDASYLTNAASISLYVRIGESAQRFRPP